VSHIPNFREASESPASSAGDAASHSGDAIVSHWRCIISFRDAHPPHPPAGESAFPAIDVIASPNCGICDTAEKFQMIKDDIYIPLLNTALLKMNFNNTIFDKLIEYLSCFCSPKIFIPWK
jgi:hypothetical protein